MAIPHKLLTTADHGDYRVIAEIYNSRHRGKDNATISSSYVGKLIRQERPIIPGAANEVIQIAIRFLQQKHKTKERLIYA